MPGAEALALSNPAQQGGIDLTAGRMNVQTRSSGDSSAVTFNGAWIRRLQDAPGLTPVITDMRPMPRSVASFLGATAADLLSK